MTYRLRRILTELAIHRRGAVWGSSVIAALLLLSVVSFTGNVRWWEKEFSTLSEELGDRLGQPRPLSPDDFVIVGITDDCLKSVPPLAKSLQVPGVTADIRTWRALHGTAMKELAGAAPMAVVWDFFFQQQRDEDPLLVEGAHALHEKQVPVVFGVDMWEDDGSPRLSPVLFNSLKDTAHFGWLWARKMSQRPGEFVLVQRQGSNNVPSLWLVTASAIARQDKQLVLDWQERSTTLSLRYREMGKTTLLPIQDRLVLSKTYSDYVKSSRGETLAELGFKTYGLNRPELWDARVIPYSRLFEFPGERDTLVFDNKIVIFGDLRSASLFGVHDRHTVKYGNELVPKVPGCYLIADAIIGLSDSHYLRSAFPVNMFTLLVAMVFGIFGCAIPAVPAFSLCMSTASKRRLVMASAAIVYFASCGTMLASETKPVVLTCTCLACFSLTLFFSAQTESVRQRFRVEPGNWGGEKNSVVNAIPDQRTTASAPSTVAPATISADNMISPNFVTSFSLRDTG